VTRKWRDSLGWIGEVALILIDEVHLLDEVRPGPAHHAAADGAPGPRRHAGGSRVSVRSSGARNR
jgi:hypothetical protein